MVISVAHLGSPGTYAEAPALADVNRLTGETGQQAQFLWLRLSPTSLIFTPPSQKEKQISMIC